MEREEQQERERKERMILGEIMTWNEKKAEIVDSIKKEVIAKVCKKKNNNNLENNDNKE
jgi:hypothetical protein